VMRPSRRGLIALVVAGSVPLLASCGLLSPTSTDVEYDAANGVTAQLGDVVARDLLVVGTEGSEGLVSGALYNSGSTDAQVTIETKGQPQPVQVDVPPGQLVTIGSTGSRATVVVGNLTKPAGTFMDLTLTSPSGGTVVTAVPVVLPRFEYATVTPTAN
jgi:hypothetical protein